MKRDVMKAIRARCLDCRPDGVGEVKNCSNINCPLYPYRMGKDPFAKRGKNKEKEEEEEV